MAGEPSIVVQKSISFLDICKASGNLEALYRKNVVIFTVFQRFKCIGMINQAADGGHIGASYALAINSIFKGDLPKGSDDEDDIRCELCSSDLELDYVVKFLPQTRVVGQ
ncbi:hypothetical protein H5410_002432 [Solanum commersonii]|uniref:At2g35280-like TPR domain-containing protein n=1 Tax=Solanum commersonii TaxID=4109 RepID=A0A9J6B2A2_SOLCO|nr:hypothetical protein H5410_002432 [Solanum commersonii]